MSHATQETWTVAKILQWTTAHLKQRGSETPRLDAEILLAHARHCPRIQLYTRFEEELRDEERTTMRDLVRRRAAGEPVAYLVGHREFFSLDFTVTPAVLIPRPDTETLVVELLDSIRDIPQPRVLDLCTGSGCVAIATAVRHAEAQVTAIDVSPDALAVARENALKHGCLERVRLLEGDLFTPLVADAASVGKNAGVSRPEPGFPDAPDAGTGADAGSVGYDRFHAIASNPPYVPSGEWDSLDPGCRFEPRIALDGGPDGMEILRRIVAGAAEFLEPDGVLLLELDPPQADTIATAIKAGGRFGDVRIVKDLEHRPRVAVARNRL